MNHPDFTIGGLFWCGGRQWRCTDLGTRTVIAIRVDSVEVRCTDRTQGRTLTGAEAETDGWFNGPPYAVAEHVFDEDGIEGCTADPEGCVREVVQNLSGRLVFLCSAERGRFFAPA